VIACATRTPNVSSEYSLASHPGAGVVVLSFTHTLITASLSYRAIGEGKRGWFDSGTAYGPLDWNDPPGRLVVAELPVGRYELYEWDWSNGDLSHVSPTFSVAFEVSEGQASYVGNVFLDVHWAAKTCFLRVLDASERDLALLNQLYPDIRGSDVHNNVTEQVIDQWAK
jgi:hypothetical protein